MFSIIASFWGIFSYNLTIFKINSEKNPAYQKISVKSPTYPKNILKFLIKLSY